jgi:hypothetical protein
MFAVTSESYRVKPGVIGGGGRKKTFRNYNNFYQPLFQMWKISSNLWIMRRDGRLRRCSER